MTIPSPPPLPPAAQAPTASQQAITALVLGILSLVCCPLVGPVAWYMGNAEGKAIREGRAPAAGETLAKVGFILGILGSLWLAFWLIWMMFGGIAVLSGIMQHNR
jgi:hypothetical protein